MIYRFVIDLLIYIIEIDHVFIIDYEVHQKLTLNPETAFYCRLTRCVNETRLPCKVISSKHHTGLRLGSLSDEKSFQPMSPTVELSITWSWIKKVLL